MADKKFKFLFLVILLILSIGMVSAATDADAGMSNDELTLSTDLAKNLSEADNTVIAESDLSSSDSLEISEIGENDNVLSASNEETIAVSDSEVLSDDDNAGYIVNGKYNGGTTSHGYTIYCADEDLNPPVPLSGSNPTPIYLAGTDILNNSFYNTNVGEMLKILIYNYFDEIQDADFTVYYSNGKKIKENHYAGDELMQYVIWALTDAEYRSEYKEAVISYEGNTEHTNVYVLIHKKASDAWEFEEAAEKYPDLLENPLYSYIVDNQINSYQILTGFLTSITDKVVAD